MLQGGVGFKEFTTGDSVGEVKAFQMRYAVDVSMETKLKGCCNLLKNEHVYWNFLICHCYHINGGDS